MKRETCLCEYVLLIFRSEGKTVLSFSKSSFARFLRDIPLPHSTAHMGKTAVLTPVVACTSLPGVPCSPENKWHETGNE